jgi:LAS superfamily LD-carboxypeptidase LdcB
MVVATVLVATLSGAGVGLLIFPDDKQPALVPVAAPSPAPTSPTPTPSLIRATSASAAPATPTRRATSARPTPARSTTPPRRPKASPSATPTLSGTAGLTPALAARVRAAHAAMRKDGRVLRINSGWRSLAEQRRLWRAAVKKYGSEKAARRWVLPPGESLHPKGKAIDIGPPSTAAWLGTNGYRFGLCQRYANEPWHFEALVAPGSRCPKPKSGAAG